MCNYPLDGVDVIRNSTNIEILERSEQQLAGILKAFRRDAIGECKESLALSVVLVLKAARSNTC